MQLLEKKMTAGALYSATLEQEEAQSTLLLTPGTALSLCLCTGRQAWRVGLFFPKEMNKSKFYHFENKDQKTHKHEDPS